MSAVHQFLPVFAAGDAIGNHVLAIRDALRDAGYDSDIFADDIHPPVRRHARPYREFTAPGDARSTLALYHLSTGSRVAAHLAGLGVPLAVDYHNITPARYFERWMPEAAEVARAARVEMRRLAPATRAALADSTYNAAELADDGYPEPTVVPILVDFSRYDAPPDASALARLRRLAERRAGAGTGRGGGAHWLCVSRIAANKAQHDVIASFALFRRLYDPAARLSIVGGRTLLLYARALERLAVELGVDDAVEFTDVLTFGELLARYRSADVVVSLSEHEGFCVPALEAMHLGVPVVAFAAGAVSETVGDAAVLLTDKDPLAVATAVDRVLTDDGLRKALVEAGHRRVEHFSLANNRRRLLDAVARITADLAADTPADLAADTPADLPVDVADLPADLPDEVADLPANLPADPADVAADVAGGRPGPADLAGSRHNGAGR